MGRLTAWPYWSGAEWDVRAASDIPPHGGSLRADLENTAREDLERRRLEEMGGAILEPRFETIDEPRQHSVRVD
jgi:hypothetical protein